MFKYNADKSSPAVKPKFLYLLSLYVLFVYSLIHTYTFQIAEANAYMGMQPWEMTVIGWFFLAIGMPTIILIISKLKGHPSDFFIIFYSLITITSFLSLNSVSGKIHDFNFLTSLLIITLPIIFIMVLKRLMPKLKFNGVFSKLILEKFIYLILFLIIIYSYVNPPASAGFSFIDSYDRRLEGRDIYQSGGLAAYVMAMSMNGIIPLIGFKAGLLDKIKTLFLALALALFFFWLLGTKAPIIYVIGSYFFGRSIRIRKITSFAKTLLIGIIGLYCIALIEWFFFDEYSIIADYFFRRLFPVQAEVAGYYLDFILNDKSLDFDWNWFTGSLGNNFQSTYYIGKNYFGNEATNANTNAFLYAFAAGGLGGYLISTICVSGILAAFDRLYQSSLNPTYYYLGFIYGLLVVEQSFTTAFVSSGVGLLFLLTALEKQTHKEYV